VRHAQKVRLHRLGLGRTRPRFGSPNLLIETVITEQRIPAEVKVFSVWTVSGKQAIIQSGTLEYAVTASVLDDGTVDVRAVLTDKQKNKKLATTRINAQLGNVSELEVGQFAFKTKTALAK
jgi:hypothetical protein